jgi:hypothetical protein
VKETVLSVVFLLVLVLSVGIFFARGLNAVFNAMGASGYLVFAATALILSAWMWFSAEPVPGR